MIATVVPGGFNAFPKLEEQEKLHWRQLAIDTTEKEYANSGQVAVVAGHFMFWPEEDEAGRLVYTQHDLSTFTQILYLDVPAEIVAQRRLDDTEKSRSFITVTHLRRWQQAEKTQLRRLCRYYGILFSLVFPYPMLLNKVLTLLRDFRQHTEKHDLFHAQSRLKEALVAGQGQLETVLIMNGDGTLAAEDTGTLFWKRVPNSQRSRDEECPLKTLFSGPLGYSYTAFRRAVLLYEETADDEEFNALSQDVASAVTMYPELVFLLQLVAEQKHVGVVVITCGLCRVWDKVLEKQGLSKTVEVIGGGRIADGFIVTAAVKAALVPRLRDVHHMYVWAFGDSPLDLDMLSRADQAIVVVSEEQTRSKTMDAALLKEHEVVDSVLCRRSRHASIQVLHAINRNATKLLMTPMRDVTVAGPVRIGRYLATEFLADVIGVEKYTIPHVQGHHTSGYRLLHKQQTSIVALMRGGEARSLFKETR